MARCLFGFMAHVALISCLVMTELWRVSCTLDGRECGSDCNSLQGSSLLSMKHTIQNTLQSRMQTQDIGLHRDMFQPSCIYTANYSTIVTNQGAKNDEAWLISRMRVVVERRGQFLKMILEDGSVFFLDSNYHVYMETVDKENQDVVVNVDLFSELRGHIDDPDSPRVKIDVLKETVTMEPELVMDDMLMTDGKTTYAAGWGESGNKVVMSFLNQLNYVLEKTSKCIPITAETDHGKYKWAFPHAKQVALGAADFKMNIWADERASQKVLGLLATESHRASTETLQAYHHALVGEASVDSTQVVEVLQAAIEQRNAGIQGILAGAGFWSSLGAIGLGAVMVGFSVLPGLGEAVDAMLAPAEGAMIADAVGATAIGAAAETGVAVVPVAEGATAAAEAAEVTSAASSAVSSATEELQFAGHVTKHFVQPMVGYAGGVMCTGYAANAHETVIKAAGCVCDIGAAGAGAASLKGMKNWAPVGKLGLGVMTTPLTAGVIIHNTCGNSHPSVCGAPILPPQLYGC